MTLSNYEIMRNQMRNEFIKYDKTKMIQKYSLKHDFEYLYLDFVQRQYRINRKNGTVKSFAPGNNMFQSAADYFNGKVKELMAACEILGEKTDIKGDVAAKIYPFSFMPVILQYWEADDEFPANLKFMYDENILEYMHYETIFFMTGHLIERIKDTMKGAGEP